MECAVEQVVEKLFFKLHVFKSLVRHQKVSKFALVHYFALQLELNLSLALPSPLTENRRVIAEACLAPQHAHYFCIFWAFIC